MLKTSVRINIFEIDKKWLLLILVDFGFYTRLKSNACIFNWYVFSNWLTHMFKNVFLFQKAKSDFRIFYIKPTFSFGKELHSLFILDIWLVIAIHWFITKCLHLCITLCKQWILKTMQVSDLPCDYSMQTCDYTMRSPYARAYSLLNT